MNERRKSSFEESDRIMKSILFTCFKDKLLDGTKFQTFRCLFIPTYEIGDIVKIMFKENNIKELLFHAEIVYLYPQKIRNLTNMEAKADGFENDEEFKKKIMELNNIKSVNRWGFVIGFKKIKDMLEWLS